MFRLLMAFTGWLQNTPLALAVGGSDWAYPYIQLTHFTGLSLWLGSSVAVDLRFLGLIKGTQKPARLSDALFFLNWIGFGIAMIGGGLLFSISAQNYVLNPAFRAKLGVLLPLALVSHIVVQRKAHAWSQTPEPPVAAKLISSIELMLWLSVAAAAVSIPYF
jgi:hypothetical protein